MNPVNSCGNQPRGTCPVRNSAKCFYTVWWRYQENSIDESF